MPATRTRTRSSRSRVNTRSKFNSGVLSLPSYTSMAKKKATDEKKRGESAGQDSGERCNWSSADELRLLDYVTTHKAKGGDGLNFDKTFWTQAAADVAHTTTTGAVKTAEACQQKWSRMRATHSVVNRVTNFSGISWSHELGANITPESESVWVDLVREIPLAKSFKNKGWLPYEKMNTILPSKARGSHAYHPLLQHGPNSEASASATSHAFSFQEVDAQEQSKALESLESGTGKTSDKDSDTLMMPAPSFFDPASQPTFVPSTPGASSTMLISVSKGKGKRKDDRDNDDNLRALIRPPNSSKSVISPSASGRSIKSARISMPEAVQQVGSEIQGLSKGLTTSFDRATTALEERTAHTISHSVDPIPLRKQKAILQVQEEEGLEDHEVIAIIEHFRADVSIADSYLAIKRDNLRKLFLMKYIT